MRRVGGGASDGGLGRACRISQGCGQGWACRPRGPPCAVTQMHVPPNAWSGRACRPVLPLCRAMQMHPATPLSGGTCWPMTPAHLKPCSFSRPHLSAQAGHAGPGRAVLPPRHPCCQIRSASQLSAMQVLTTSAVRQAGHAGQPCGHKGTPCSPTFCARQPCSGYPRCLVVQPQICTTCPQVHVGAPLPLIAQR